MVIKSKDCYGNDLEICETCYHPVSEVDTCHHPECQICKKCRGAGWNHGVQCKPSKKHPTGWKTVKCDCGG